MKIDAIDVYWMKLPLAFVWKTSYADQSFTDTILVRMEGGGHEAWGESCPPFIPGYSAEHTLAVFHTLREHMVPRIIGQDIETAQDLLDRLAFIKGNQFARAALDIAWWVLDAKRRGLPLHRALGGTADRVAVGADFGIQDSLDDPDGEDPGRHRRRLPAGQAQVPAGLGSLHGGGGAVDLPRLHLPRRLQRGLHRPPTPSSSASSTASGSP